MRGFYPKGSRVFPQKFVVPATQKAVSIVIDGNVIVVVTIVVIFGGFTHSFIPRFIPKLTLNFIHREIEETWIKQSMIKY